MNDQLGGTGAGSPSSELPHRDRLRQSRLVLTGIAIVLLVWLAVANLQDVKIHFWVTSAAAPLIVVVAISAALGAAASGLWSRRQRQRQRRHRSRTGATP